MYATTLNHVYDLISLKLYWYKNQPMFGGPIKAYLIIQSVSLRYRREILENDDDLVKGR